MAEAKIDIRTEADKSKADLKDIKGGVEDITKAVEGSGNKFATMGKQMMVVGGILTGMLTIPIVSFFKGAIGTAAEFEQAMAGVKAISGATGDTFESLSTLAKELGASTRYTAVEAAQGMTMLARAGWEANEILAAMPGLLNLAAAGSVDLAIAADIVSDVMMAFGANASEATVYADVFAAAAASANTTVEALGQAMAYAAPAAAAAGFSIQTTAAALSSFADAGVKGTRAGTTLDSILRELRNKVKDGALDFGEFSVSVYDSEGAMRDLFDIIGDIEAGMAGMTQQQKDAALGMVFTTRSLRGMNIWLTRGVDSLRDLEKGLLGSSGAAQVMSSIMMDTLQGSLIEMQSAIEGLKIAFGEMFVDTGKKVVKSVTDIVRTFTNMDEAGKKVVVTILAILAGIGPLLTIIGVLTAAIGFFIANMALIVGTVLPIIAVLALVGFALVSLTQSFIEESNKQAAAHARMASTIIEESKKVIAAQNAQNAVILLDQAQRHTEAVQAEIDHLIEMGATVDNSSDLRDAYKRYYDALAAEQRAAHIERRRAEMAFAAELAEVPDISQVAEVWSKYGEVRVSAIQDMGVKEGLEWDKLHEAGVIDEDQWEAGAISIDNYFAALAGAVPAGMNRLMVPLQAGFIEAGQMLDYETGLWIPVAAYNAGELTRVLLSQLDVLPEGIRPKVEAMIYSMEGALLSGVPEIEAAGLEMVGTIATIIAEEGVHWENNVHLAMDPVVAAFIEGGNAAVESWGEGLGPIPEVTEENFKKAQEMVNTILTGPFPASVKEEANQIGLQLGEGFDKATPDVLGKVDSLVGSIEQHLAMLDFTGAQEALIDQFELMGESGAVGLETGFARNRSKPVEAVEQMADAVIEAGRKRFKVESPSQVFAEIGANIALGLAEGLLRGKELIDSAVTVMLESFSTMKDKVKVEFDGITNIITSSLQLTNIDSKRLIDAIVRNFTNLKDRISTTMNDLRDIISTTWRTAKDNIELTTKGIISIVNSNFTQVFNDTKKHLNSIVSSIRQFRIDSMNLMRAAGRAMYDEFTQWLRKIPTIVTDTIRSIINILRGAVSQVYAAATYLGRMLWEGFKKGIGMQSPSYLEKAMDAIAERAGKLPDQLMAAFDRIKDLPIPDYDIHGNANRNTNRNTNRQSMHPSTGPITLQIGTFIGDRNSLKELERKLKDIRLGERIRVGGVT